MLSGDAADGVPVLEKVIGNQPGRYEAHAMLGRHFAETGKYKDAVGELEAYLQTRPPALEEQDVPVTLTLADAQLRSGDAAGAADRFEKILVKQPRNLRAEVGRAWAAAAIDCAAAMPQLDKLLPLVEKVPEVLLVKGRCSLKLGRAAEARSLAERYLATAKSPAAGHALLGEALLALGDEKAARAALADAVRLDPSSHALILELAQVERLVGDPSSAVGRLAGTKPDPGDEPAWETEQASALLAMGKGGEGTALLTPIVARFPEDARARAVLGECQLRAGQLAAAVVTLEKATALDPRSKTTRSLFVEALRRSAEDKARAGDLPGADQLLVRASVADPDDLHLQRDLGVVRLAAGRPADAIAPLGKATAGGQDSLSHQLLGRAYALLGRTDEARKEFDVALTRAGGENDPERTTDVLLELAATELAAGDPARAAGLLEPAVAKSPRLVEAYIAAARAAAEKYMTVGNFAPAVRLLEHAEKLASAADVRVAVRCELALAATGAGERDLAADRLRQLDQPGITCPFPPPADELAVPILAALNSAGDARTMEKALDRLAALGKRATGSAQRLVDDATRLLAIRAAAEAHTRGQTDRARRFLAVAAKVHGAGGPELAYDQAVLDLDAGHVDEAMRELERLANEVPEALVALGIGWEKKGSPEKALEYFQRAQQSPTLRFGQLREWIAAKQRIYGSGAGGEP